VQQRGACQGRESFALLHRDCDLDRPQIPPTGSLLVQRNYIPADGDFGRSGPISTSLSHQLLPSAHVRGLILELSLGVLESQVPSTLPCPPLLFSSSSCFLFCYPLPYTNPNRVCRQAGRSTNSPAALSPRIYHSVLAIFAGLHRPCLTQHTFLAGLARLDPLL